MESGVGLTGLASGSLEDPGQVPGPAIDPPVLSTEIPQFAIMNEEPATICFNEDDYYCPVCQDVFKTPVRISICEHVFCRKCFLMAMKEGGPHCPLCRGIVTRKEKARPNRALDVENDMKKLVGSCRCCEKQIRFSRMRQHYKSCKRYQDEYGVPSIIPNLDISQDSTGNSFGSDSSTSEMGENSNLHVPEEPASEQSTFRCPLCQESNFTRQTLLDHCNDKHLYQVDPANLQLDEETLFQNAVEESYQVNL
ncbi:E3 ubiquitin-protein ligase RNF138 isoform X2 [Crotalus tigris]|uniref:E3 ubiquitin-protein ligase RNF138 isoform X2 n=1 Tax=Crotalus tigris TaxID=88082 RepID=UPI00192F691D|nr:E3 ubiquitin-protein ligase RNF138 isoform X2 [Crotalus tigris]